MPTFQTTPLGKWSFPDASYRRNQLGHQYAGVGQTRGNSVPVVGPASPFAAHERDVVLARLHNNKSKMLGQLGVKNTTERSQRYTNNDSQSQSHFNGVFPNDEYQFPPGGLRGGMTRASSTGGFELGGGTQKFFYFKEGQDWLESWKKRRIAELNAIEKDDYSAGRPGRIPIAPAYDDLDAILAKVLDQFESGAFSNALTDDMNKLQGSLLRMGGTITAPKLAQYIRVFGDIRRQVQRITADPEPTVNRLDAGDAAEDAVEGARRGQPAGQYRAGPYKLDAKDLKLIRAVGLIADRLVRLAREINAVINLDTPSRERAVAEIGSRILGSISGQQSAFGQATPDTRGLTFGSLAERGAREEPSRPPAELETQAGIPAVKPF